MDVSTRLSGPLRKLRGQVRGLIRMVAAGREPEVIEDAMRALDDHIYATHRCLSRQPQPHAEQASSGEAGQ